MDEIDEAELAERVNAHIEQTLAQEAAERAMAARMAAGIDDAPSPAPTKPTPTKAKAPAPRPAPKPAPTRAKAPAPKAKVETKPTTKPKPAPKKPKPKPALVPQEDSVAITGGDTLWALSRKHGIALDKLLAMNPDVDPLRLQIGQQLRLRPTPPPLPADNGTTSAGTTRAIPQYQPREQSREPVLPSYESQAIEPVYPVETAALGGLGARKLIQQVTRRPPAEPAPTRELSDEAMDALFRAPSTLRFRRNPDPRLL
jgi:LysM repeat protein